MQIIIAGTGKLATELLGSLKLDPTWQVVSWADKDQVTDQCIVVHAGSGRELPALVSYCQSTHSVLVELATGSPMEAASHGFPVVLCPNTNILMLKFMSMLAKSGPLFRGYQIRLTESHQAQKTSTPGTAVSMAHSLGLNSGDILSVRDPHVQQTALKIPAEHLARHAYHQVVIEDAVCSVTLETRVYGDSPYADGVARILAAICANPLENRLYDISEFVEKGWV
ncbi:MAG: dihydrodipicolinate reductase [Pseudomonadota bacterium]